MNNLAPDYLYPYVLSGLLAAVAALLFGLQRALKRAGWAPNDRKQVVWTSSLLLAGWFLLSLMQSRSGFFQGTSSRIPTIQYGILLPIIVGIAAFWLLPTLRRMIETVPQSWIVGVQVYRALGLIFLVLYAGGRLPGAFAWPAGVGDFAVGLLAPVVAIAYARSPHNAGGLVRAWNLLGIGDLVVAVTAGFLTSPSRFQVWALNAPNALITAFPLAMIPVFMVPLSILLHLASLSKLQAETARLIPAPVTR